MIRRPPRSTRVRSSAASDVYKRQMPDPVQRPGRGPFPHARLRAVILDVVPDPEHRRLTRLADLLVVRNRVDATAQLDPPVATFEAGVGPVWQRLLVGEAVRPLGWDERDRSPDISRGEHDAGAEHDVIGNLGRPGLIEFVTRFPPVAKWRSRLHRHEAVTGRVDQGVAPEPEYLFGSLLGGEDAVNPPLVSAIARFGRRNAVRSERWRIRAAD